MGIHNTHMYEKAIVAMAKQSVTLEVLSYHASATIDEAHRLRVSLSIYKLQYFIGINFSSNTVDKNCRYKKQRVKKFIILCCYCPINKNFLGVFTCSRDMFL